MNCLIMLNGYIMDVWNIGIKMSGVKEELLIAVAMFADLMAVFDRYRELKEGHLIFETIHDRTEESVSGIIECVNKAVMDIREEKDGKNVD